MNLSTTWRGFNARGARCSEVAVRARQRAAPRPAQTQSSDPRATPLAERAKMADKDGSDDDRANLHFPRQLVKRLILLYKDNPCLWDRNCPTYKIKQKRNDAWMKLTALVKEYDSNATRVHILRKIESLRACVRREHNRVQESKRTATCAEELYVPHLWYYGMLSFLFSNEDAGSTPVLKLKTSSDHSAESDMEEETGEADEPVFENTINYPDMYNVSVGAHSVDIDNASMSKRFYEEESSSKTKRLCTEIEDEYDAIGINVAAKLRHLPSNMRILAEKLINDVLFQAQTNGLTAATVIHTPDPFK